MSNLSAVWTQSGESGNTLKNKCSGTADERANTTKTEK